MVEKEIKKLEEEIKDLEDIKEKVRDLVKNNKNVGAIIIAPRESIKPENNILFKEEYTDYGDIVIVFKDKIIKETKEGDTYFYEEEDDEEYEEDNSHYHFHKVEEYKVKNGKIHYELKYLDTLNSSEEYEPYIKAVYDPDNNNYEYVYEPVYADEESFDLKGKKAIEKIIEEYGTKKEKGKEEVIEEIENKINKEIEYLKQELEYLKLFNNLMKKELKLKDLTLWEEGDNVEISYTLYKAEDMPNISLFFKTRNLENNEILIEVYKDIVKPDDKYDQWYIVELRAKLDENGKVKDAKLTTEGGIHIDLEIDNDFENKILKMKKESLAFKEAFSSKVNEVLEKINKALKDIITEGEIEKFKIYGRGYMAYKVKSDKGIVDYDGDVYVNPKYDIKIEVDGKEYNIKFDGRKFNIESDGLKSSTFPIHIKLADLEETIGLNLSYYENKIQYDFERSKEKQQLENFIKDYVNKSKNEVKINIHQNDNDYIDPYYFYYWR